jgi:hypothetical protein
MPTRELIQAGSLLLSNCSFGLCSIPSPAPLSFYFSTWETTPAGIWSNGCMFPSCYGATTSPLLFLFLPLRLVVTSLSHLQWEAGQSLWEAGTSAPPFCGLLAIVQFRPLLSTPNVYRTLLCQISPLMCPIDPQGGSKSAGSQALWYTPVIPTTQQDHELEATWTTL